MRVRRIAPGAVLAVAYCLLSGAGNAGAHASSAAFTGHVTASRSFVAADGSAEVVDTRHVTLSVSQTTNLRGRQEITVNWSGAHPTGGTVPDVNSGDGPTEEYPFVLLECRGTDSTRVPAAQRLSPQTCWTQTWAERFQKDNTTGWPAWRSDRYAAAADRSALVDAPSPRPAACFRAALAERWVPFVAADGTAYPGGAVGCAGMAPESANVSGAGIPSNATYGITQADGTGSAEFDVWTADENASLGCSDTVACALVAVPVMGISCDAYGTGLDPAARPPARVTAQADATCRASGAYAAGQPHDPGTPADTAVTGALWWSASNWRNRITVPLSFATPASVCAVVSKAAPVAIYGSVLMSEATAQWQPRFCTDKSLYPFVHVQTSDAAARNLLASGGIAAAFSSRPPDGSGFGRPTVQAPVALTGFAISYAIDDANGNRYTKLRLDARLLAKLLTESYPGDSLVRDNYPAIAHNPMNITQDPEFIALNPGLPQYASMEAAATLSTLSSDADLTYALTSYLNADREARTWLNGEPDPWGMTVNPTYEGIALPVESWPLLDGFTLPQSYINSQNNPCYSYSPGPYLQLIANPSSLLATVVQNVQFAISNADISCPNGVPGDIASLRLSIQGRQQPGHRFVLGVTSLSAARRYDLDTAALQTSLTTPDLQSRFTDASGRSFVAPTDAGLRAAATQLRATPAQHTWTLDYAALSTTAGAYPAAMPVYADVPTAGLGAATAAHLATFLRYAAGPGQHAGAANGELPTGYLPMTSANGLAALADYTTRAATAVAAQQGAVPPLAAPPPATPTPSAPSSTLPGSVTSPSVPTPAASTPVPAPPVGSAPASATGSTRPKAAASAPVASRTESAPAPGTIGVRTVASYSRLGSLALPLVLGLGLLCGLAGTLLRYPAAARSATAWARTALRRGRH